MTSEISPLPSTDSPNDPVAPSGVDVPQIPEGSPEGPAPKSSLDVAPFGELHEEPEVSVKAAIPPLLSEEEECDTFEPDYTDADLAEALQPLMAGGNTVPAPFASEEFEATLRCAFRRALAEHSAGPFDQPDFVQRCLWRFDALLSSRSYEEILYQKTKRFRMEEIYLFDHDRLSLVSFASIDPSRHASARKISPAAQRIAAKIRDHSGAISLDFAAGDGRRAMIRIGRWSIMAALVRGEPDALVRNDLDYALRRIETRFEHDFEADLPLLLEVQPLLEECLLIHSPVIPASV
ncbi:hypothetical protein [Haloferula sp.]|uniref:hypothetical protein n=1 Tax=Haloferula sp. TaxID=2497595 RepID=UPI00329C9317